MHSRLTIRFAALALAFISGAALAQHAGHNHPPADAAIHDRFYSDWMRPDDRKASCCNKQDCYPAEARFRAGAWYAKQRLTGQWIRIPDHKIERDRTSPDGRNHVCMTDPENPKDVPHVYCFVPGAGT